MAQKLYEVVLNGVYYGQKTVNRFNYYVSPSDGAAATANNLANAMGLPFTTGAAVEGSLLEALQDLVSSNYLFSSMFVRDVYSNTDFTERFIDGTGTVAGESLSPVMAFGFRTNIKNLAVHRGMKRFAGVAESSSSAGGTLTGGAITLAEALAAKMSETIVDVNADIAAFFVPCVVGKEKYVVPGSDPVRYAYRYFPTVDEQFDSLAIGVTWENYDNSRTQVSRQYGRGD